MSLNHNKPCARPRGGKQTDGAGILGRRFEEQRKVAAFEQRFLGTQPAQRGQSLRRGTRACRIAARMAGAPACTLRG